MRASGDPDPWRCSIRAGSGMVVALTGIFPVKSTVTAEIVP